MATQSRVGVKKTYKLFIGGKFPRTESGRYFPIHGANICQASRKDLRDAVVAAEKAQPGWAKATPYLRGQILYRMAEVLETRKAAFVEELTLQTGVSLAKARREVEAAIDRLVWYAGWADKFTQCFGAVNPVAAPFFNFTIPEPMGVVGIIAPDEYPLLSFVSKVAPAIVSGNAVVILASETAPLTAISFAEVLATSDLPGGVVNILTGYRSELLPIFASHMAIRGVDYSGDVAEDIATLQRDAATSVKRVVIRQEPSGDDWLDDELAQSPYWIDALTEAKTAWHPIGV